MAKLLRTTALLATLAIVLPGAAAQLTPIPDADEAHASSTPVMPDAQVSVQAVDDDDDHHGMWGGWDGWGWWLFMVPMMVVFWGGLLWLIVWLVRQSSGEAGGRGNDATEIARQRYARGEISREEFEQIRRDLRD